MAPAIALPIDEYRKAEATALEEISDAVDDINVRKLLAKEEKSKKEKSEFRVYEDDRTRKFYTEQHTKQTVEFNKEARRNAGGRASMSIWEAIELLDSLVDDSDPDTQLSQIEHALQTAEAIRNDGKPEWMQVTGLVHDLGKLLFFLYDQPQWAVVGDTFVVGAPFSDKIVYPETFTENPDYNHPVYSKGTGIYEEGCGLENLMISWGHDEYLYKICKEQSKLPSAALHMIRYHSFYPWHREGAYREFMIEKDHEALKDVLEFNPYDLYSKSDERPDAKVLKGYYCDLIAKFFPEKINF